MILCALELEILSKLDFYDSHFEKWPEPIFRTNFFSGNISNIIPRIPLDKMVQFLDSSGGGGCTVTPSGPWTINVGFNLIPTFMQS